MNSCGSLTRRCACGRSTDAGLIRARHRARRRLRHRHRNRARAGRSSGNLIAPVLFDGGIDWLPAPSAEDYGYSEFIDTVDTIVMGRKTFELALTFGAWPYKKPVVVLTSHASSLPGPLPAGVRTSSGAPDAILAELTSAGTRHVYVDGGVTIRRFLEAGRISRIIITTVPVLIGSGRIGTHAVDEQRKPFAIDNLACAWPDKNGCRCTDAPVLACV